MGRITIIAHEQVRERMAAPAIRYSEMARTLAMHGHDVALAIHNEPEVDLEPVRQIHDEAAGLATEMACSDVVIIGGGPYPETPPNAPPPHVPRVVDMTFPLLLEGLAMHRVDPESWPQTRLDLFTAVMTARLRAADVVLCASVEQRHLYIGWLAAIGRLSAQLVERDAAVDQLVRVVPFGCPSHAPSDSGNGPRRVIDGIADNDHLVLWSGHVTDWYDPGTAVRAVMAASSRVPSVRLVFLGAGLRDERLGPTPTGTGVRALARRLDPDGRHVFFWSDWVPYEHRADWLLEADCAVIASPRTLEADLAVRARFLDYVWCALPLITTAGGTFAQQVRRGGLGIVVDPGDVDGMADAIVRLRDAEERELMRGRLRSIRGDHEWERALAPLLAFCDAPSVAPDRDEWHTVPTPQADRRRTTLTIQRAVGRAAARIRGAAGRVA